MIAPQWWATPLVDALGSVKRHEHVPAWLEAEALHGTARGRCWAQREQSVPVRLAALFDALSELAATLPVVLRSNLVPALGLTAWPPLAARGCDTWIRSANSSSSLEAHAGSRSRTPEECRRRRRRSAFPGSIGAHPDGHGDLSAGTTTRCEPARPSHSGPLGGGPVRQRAANVIATFHRERRTES